MIPELKEVLFEALGEASMCWSETPKGVFKSDRCKEIGEKVIRVFDRAAEERGVAALQSGEAPSQQLKPKMPSCEEILTSLDTVQLDGMSLQDAHLLGLHRMYNVLARHFGHWADVVQNVFNL